MASTTASSRRERTSSPPQQQPPSKASSAPPTKATSPPPFVRRSSSSYKASSPIIENQPPRASSAAPSSAPLVAKATLSSSRLGLGARSSTPASPTTESDARLGSPAPHTDARPRAQSRGTPVHTPTRETPPPVLESKPPSPSGSAVSTLFRSVIL